MQRFSDLRTPFLTIAFFFIVLFLYTRLFGPITFKVNSQPNLFYVKGVGKQTAIPTTVVATIGITETGSSADEIKNRINTKMNKIVSEFKNLGVPEKNIKTINYSVHPNYDISPRLNTEVTTEAAIVPEQNRISSYIASQTVEVEVENVQLANRVLDTATKNGANTISTVYFKLGDEEKEELEQKARTEAIKNAKDKAARIAKSSGLRLGNLVNVSENNGPLPYAETSAVKEDQASSTRLSPGESTVEINVTLTYETL